LEKELENLVLELGSALQVPAKPVDPTDGMPSLGRSAKDT
jgi:hypothetical protein